VELIPEGWRNSSDVVVGWYRMNSTPPAEPVRSSETC